MKKLIKTLIICSIVFTAGYLFAGYVLVPHPDNLPHYVPSLIQQIQDSKPLDK